MPVVSLVASANPPQSSLQPGQAVTVLNDRLKLIGKINLDIADWLQVQLLGLKTKNGAYPS